MNGQETEIDHAHGHWETTQPPCCHQGAEISIHDGNGSGSVPIAAPRPPYSVL